jgi:hypothetical protein
MGKKLKNQRRKKSRDTISSVKNNNDRKNFNWENPPRWFPYVIFLIATLVFFREQIFGTFYFWASFMSDFNELHIPYQTFAIENLKSFHIPFWNPYTYNGMPFLADIQVGFFYPFNFLLFLFVKAGDLPVKALEYQIILHFFIAQVSMFLLARELKISILGSIIAALSFSFSGILVYRIIIQTFIYQLVWLPLIFLFFYKISKEMKLKYSLLAGLLLGMLLLTGHPQAFFYNSLFILFFIVFSVIWGLVKKENDRKQTLWFLFLSGLPFIIAIGISAIQIFHTYELASLSKRTLLTLQEAADGSLQIKQLLTAFIPKLFGSSDMMHNHIPFYLVNKGYIYWETGFYFGLTAIILGTIGWAKQIKSPLGIFMIVIAVFGFLHAMGINGFLFQIVFQLPLFDKFRFPVRTMYYVVFAFTLYAGFGFDILKNQAKGENRILIVLSIAIPILITVSVFSGFFTSLLGTPDKFVSSVSDYSKISLLLSVIIGIVIFLFINKKVSAMIAGVLFILIIIFDLNYNLGSFKNSKISSKQVYKIDRNIENLLRAKPPNDIFRVKMRNKFVLPFQRNSGLVNKIMFYEGFNPLQLLKKTPPGKKSLDLLSVKYQIETDLEKKKSYFKQRNTFLPHERMTYKTKEFSVKDIIRVMKSEDIDYKNISLVEKKLSLKYAQKNRDSVTSSVKCLQYTSDYQKYEIDTEENGLLNISEVWYPAWKAKIDTRETEIYRINYCLRGVEIPRGKHIVEFSYESNYFLWGVFVSLFTLLTIFTSLFVINRLQKTN